MTKKGINLGCWLNPEGYIFGGRNFPFHEFCRKFENIYGKSELNVFKETFYKNYITEKDFEFIKQFKIDFVRLPVHFAFIEKSPYEYDEEHISFLKKIFSWAEKNKIFIILDLHAAPGSQNADWHSDSSGVANLWKFRSNKERTYKLWEVLIENLKNEKALYGYDVLNEPVGEDEVILNFYKTLLEHIIKLDNEHKIFFEGNIWSQKIDFLEDFFIKNSNKNIHISIHNYSPINFTYNFVKNSRYPGVLDGEMWNKDKIYKYLEPYKNFKEKHNIDLLVGEFGINPRNNTFGEIDFLNDLLSVYKDYGFDWTYWTYKAVTSGTFPDGILQYNDNPSWVRREGNIFGLETYYTEWKNKKNDIIFSWSSENFVLNKFISKSLFEN